MSLSLSGQDGNVANPVLRELGGLSEMMQVIKHVRLKRFLQMEGSFPVEEEA